MTTRFQNISKTTYLKL